MQSKQYIQIADRHFLQLSERVCVFFPGNGTRISWGYLSYFFPSPLDIGMLPVINITIAHGWHLASSGPTS
jgi:hypothetical protein